MKKPAYKLPNEPVLAVGSTSGLVFGSPQVRFPGPANILSVGLVLKSFI